MAKEPFTFESNLGKMTKKIEETPYKVLNVVGLNIVKEVRPHVAKRGGRLVKSLQYWARKNEKDLQIGMKEFYAPFVHGHDDPIKPVVVKNKYLIQELIAKALNDIGKR